MLVLSSISSLLTVVLSMCFLIGSWTDELIKPESAEATDDATAGGAVVPVTLVENVRV